MTDELEAELTTYKEWNETQAETIVRLNAENFRERERNEKQQAMIEWLQKKNKILRAENDDLHAQLTPEAKAEWVFEAQGAGG